MPDIHPGEVTQLLAQLRSGDAAAADQLIPLVYDELRRIAAHYMRSERNDHTLQATALVHEALLRLLGPEPVDWQNRAHFLGMAALAMRRVLVDHARHRNAAKNGGMQRRVELHETMAATGQKSVDIVALDKALDRLAELSPQQARIIELHCFAGMGHEAVAEVLGVATKTVQRHWNFAKTWLREELRTGGQHEPGALG